MCDSTIDKKINKYHQFIFIGDVGEN